MNNMYDIDISGSGIGAAHDDAALLFQNTIRKQIIERFDGRCFLLVDPAAAPLDNPAIDGPTFADLDWVPILVSHPAFPTAHAPRLAELDLNNPHDIHLFSRSIQLARQDREPARLAGGTGQRIGGWLATKGSIEEVANHWSSLILQDDERGRPHALRFYDPRVTSLLWPLLGDQQRRGLLGSIDTWHSFDACAAPCTYEAPQLTPSAFTLRKEQWADIREHGYVNKALGLMMLEQGRQPTPQDVKTAVAAARRPRVYGITDATDKVQFILHALTWHPYFDAHPQVTNALREVGPDTFYGEAISNLSDTDIADIRAGKMSSLAQA